MVYAISTLKWMLIIVNSFNISCALIHIIATLIFYKDNDTHTEDMYMNYIMMLISSVCCAAAVMESSCLLEVAANLFLSEIVTKVIIWIYVQSFSLYTIFGLLLHGIIVSITYYLAQRIRKTKLHNIISAYTGIAAIPLVPPPHLRSDVI